MDIRVSGHQVDTGEALRNHVNDRLKPLIEKYFSQAISSHIIFGKEPHNNFRSDIVAHIMQGLVLKGTGKGETAHRAFDDAVEKIEKQVRRYKRRIQDRHSQAQFAIKQENAAYRVFPSGLDDKEIEVKGETDNAGDAPAIIAEMSVDIPEASVSDAVMLMDLRNTSALLFKNAASGRHNMVYRRDDGTIGWVEPG